MKNEQIMIALAIAAGIFLLFKNKAAGAGAPLNFGIGWGSMPTGFNATSAAGNVDIGFGVLPSGQAKMNGLINPVDGFVYQ
jgi:hypothetical protein